MSSHGWSVTYARRGGADDGKGGEGSLIVHHGRIQLQWAPRQGDGNAEGRGARNGELDAGRRAHRDDHAMGRLEHARECEVVILIMNLHQPNLLS